MQNTKIGFLSSCRFENNGIIRGALLVTDTQTKPIEFRVTSPIKPTNFQKTLYGDLLEEHLAIELLTLPLIEAIKEKPSLIIVREPVFLRVADKIDIDIVHIYKENEVQYGADRKTEQISSLGGKYEPLFIQTAKTIEDRLPELRKRLAEIFSQRNLLEPFDRVKLACEQVHLQKVGE